MSYAVASGAVRAPVRISFSLLREPGQRELFRAPLGEHDGRAVEPGQCDIDRRVARSCRAGDSEVQGQLPQDVDRFGAREVGDQRGGRVGDVVEREETEADGRGLIGRETREQYALSGFALFSNGAESS